MRSGYSYDTPPDIHWVTIYFLQKNSNEEEALNFFCYYNAHGWEVTATQNKSFWKTLANGWIWNKKKESGKEELAISTKNA